jgi:hypothetical protein
MNRLLIIGNGFDLAHGLKTSYSDFIRNYWTGLVNPNHSDDLITIKTSPDVNIKDCNSLGDTIKRIFNQHKYRANYYGYEDVHLNGEHSIIFNNHLFGELCKIENEINWVDMEIYYYQELKKTLNDNPSNISYVKQLNNELFQIIKHFDSYLLKEVLPNIAASADSIINSHFENTINSITFEVFKKEFSASYGDKMITKYFNDSWFNDRNQPKFRNTQVLNFNYTNTISNYFDFSKNDVELVNIHGEVDSNAHPINMGFGDEVDEFYRKIENSGENEYLRFVKSFYYSNNSHYKRLLDFIEMDDFQCQIMGHSCGLSDRTLLKTIFEHQKCKSIKPFYYTYDEENEWHEKDNYLEIVKNISRHFSDKKMMREKVVNKEFCLPLPQVKRKSVEENS